MPDPQNRITFVGHATAVVERDGREVLTDPLLRDGILGLLRRRAPSPDIERLRSPDLVLISHDHRDHLDPPSLRLVSGASAMVTPPGFARYSRRAGAAEVIELPVGSSATAGGVEVEAVRADHGGARDPWRRARPKVGYVMPGDPSVYFAGDTDVFDEMEELRGRVDVALLPIAGWGPKVGEGHMDAERAARATELIAPELVIPIHWGTFAPPVYRVRDLEEPARDFERLVGERAPGTRVAVLQPGESLDL